MKVRHLSGPKANTIEHLQPHVAQTLAAAGLCEIIPFKDFREMLAASMPPAKAPVIEWGVQEANLSQFSRVTVIKRCGSEVTYFTAPLPSDCPPSIVARFQELTGGKTAQEISPDYAAVLAEGAFVGDSNKHRPIYMGADKEGKPVYVNPEEFVTRK